MWLQAASSNNDPRIIGSYYVKCVRSIQGVYTLSNLLICLMYGWLGCPKILRTDNGTENSILSVIQPILRHNHADSLAGEKSFLYGKSINNQRIEALWCQLRKQFMDWWIHFFKVLFNYYLIFSYTPIIEPGNRQTFRNTSTLPYVC